MNRILRLTLLNCILLPFIASGSSEAADTQPNILVIVGDDMGYADVGFHGCKDTSTPNLDALASSGVRFTNGYVSGPYCSPTRAGLLTGRYQQRFGHEFNGGGAGGGLPVTETTIGNRLKSAGYATGIVGKWHLGSNENMHPEKRGFDEFFGFLGGAHSYFDGNGILRGTKPADEQSYLTDAFGREAVSFIERHDGKPWFLYLAFNAVHTPMHADDIRLKKFASIEDKQRRTYAAMMFAMDEAIGSVRKAIADKGQTENTLVAFISDNGGPTMVGVTINGSVNKPLRGSKRTTLEGGVRVPFVVSWPGRIKPGVFDQPAIQLDLHATALAAANVELKPEWKLDGVNLLPFLSGTKSGSPHEDLFWRFGEQMAIRTGDYKLVRYDLAAEASPDQPKKGTSEVRLYNLREDIGETKDLYESQPAIAKKLQSRWDLWNKSNIPPGSIGDESKSEKGNEKKRNKAK